MLWKLGKIRQWCSSLRGPFDSIFLFWEELLILFYFLLTHLLRVTAPASRIPLTNTWALTLASCKEVRMFSLLLFQTTQMALYLDRGVTYQVQDKERGKGAVGLDSVCCHRGSCLNCHIAGFKSDDGGFHCLHQQFHHQTWEKLGNLKIHRHI